MIPSTFNLTEDEREILRVAGLGSMSDGVREMAVIYRDLWALGYRPTVPVKLFVRRYAKKKAPVKGPKRETSTARPEDNTDQDS